MQSQSLTIVLTNQGPPRQHDRKVRAFEKAVTVLEELQVTDTRSALMWKLLTQPRSNTN
jgi:hypothetical protein